MAYERMAFAPGDQDPRFWKAYAITVAPLFLLIWLASGSLWGALFGSAVLSVFGVGFWWASKRTSVRMAAAKVAFRQRGYEPDFQLGTLLIDSKAKMLGIADLNNAQIDLYSTQDILAWQHHWIDRVSSQSNAWGNRTMSHTTATKNAIVLKTNNPACPIYRIPVDRHAVGEVWVARLSAIING